MANATSKDNTGLLKITSETLKKWKACIDGFRRFCELFLEGADLRTAAEGLAADGHSEWSIWLFDNCRKDDDYKDQAIEGFSNAGDSNAGDSNAGHSNAGHWNAGHWNAGHWNAGHWNAGHWNAGDRNAGHWNAGHWNAGDSNAGHWNAGDSNAGHWNAGDRNAGHFNTISPKQIMVFNKPCLYETWDNAHKPYFIFRVNPTRWISESEMTDEEKVAHPNFYAMSGYLKNITFAEAWADAWSTATPQDKELLKALPNFDADVFRQISGIDVSE